jgi:hypothetical protein
MRDGQTMPYQKAYALNPALIILFKEKENFILNREKAA